MPYRFPPALFGLETLPVLLGVGGAVVIVIGLVLIVFRSRRPAVPPTWRPGDETPDFERLLTPQLVELRTRVAQALQVARGREAEADAIIAVEGAAAEADPSKRRSRLRGERIWALHDSTRPRTGDTAADRLSLVERLEHQLSAFDRELEWRESLSDLG